MTPTDDTGASRWRRPILAVLLLATVVLGTRDITHEDSVMLGGDMSRYMMNGVFFYDLVADGGVWSTHALVDRAERYFARYPALTLGHHPPLPSLAVVPFYAVFGISTFAARVTALGWFLFAVMGLYQLAGRLLGDWRAASWATALFITNVMVLRAGQYLLSEMPMVALVLASLNALLAYSESQRMKFFTWFVALATASLFAKQLAVFMIPVHVAILAGIARRRGWRALAGRKLSLVIALAALLVASLAFMTIVFSPANVGLALWNATQLFKGTRDVTVGHILATIIRTHLSVLTLIAAAAGTAVLLVRRQWQVLLILLWVGCVWGGTVVVAGAIEPARYAFGAVPAYCLLAAGLATATRTRGAKLAAACVLSVAVIAQSWTVRNVRPSGAGGYESVAQYVVNHTTQASVLYDSAVDTGYFVFFVRKHDPARRLVVLRADKLMTTPAVDDSGPVSRFSSAGDIYALLERFGVQYVVVEERDAGPNILRLLHTELATDRFVERLRTPIVSTTDKTAGADLVVYEFKDARPADPNAELDMQLPLSDREIKLRMRDLIGGGTQ